MPAPAIIGIGSLVVTALGKALKKFVFKVLTVLGIAKITYEGLDTIITHAKVMFREQITSLDPAMLSLVGYFELDKVVTLLFSALLVRQVITATTRFASVTN